MVLHASRFPKSGKHAARAAAHGLSGIMVPGGSHGGVMVPLYTPKSESEAAVITAMLRAYGVHFHMQGAAFSTMYPGALSTSLNAQTLLVRQDQVELARQLIQGFIDGPS